MVLAAAVVASAFLSASAQLQIDGQLNASWRGAYDILVRPAGQSLGLSSTDGFVEGNFVATTGHGGISLKQLAAIRKISGVDVAAPIGLVGEMRYHLNTPMVDVPDIPSKGTTPLPAQPALYQLSWALSLDGVGGPRVVQSGSGHVELRRQLKDDSPDRLVAIGDGGAAGSATWDPTLGIMFTLDALPSFSRSVIAVDPVAEAKLLGKKGSLLDSLAQFPSGDRTAKSITPLLNTPKYENLPDDLVNQQHWIEFAGRSQDPARQQQPVVPMLVNTTPGAQLSYTFTVAQSDQPVPFASEQDAFNALVARTHSYKPVGSSTTDLSRVLVPFTSPYIDIAWPGTTPPTGQVQEQGSATDLQPILVGRPSYTSGSSAPAAPGGLPAFRVTPRGVVQIDGRAKVDQKDATSVIAGTQSYRITTTTSGKGLDNALSLPVGSFDASALPSDTGAASYVPYGAYDPATTTWFAGPDGRPLATPEQITASPSGVDFISGLPGAITDLAGARVLRGDDPIDAIRVRVAGITSYTPAAQQQVAQVAAEIQAMGLQVTVVAGSSPQPVEIYVPDYVISRSGQVSDLGLVRQDWTTLGAAVTVSSAMSELVWWLLGLVLLAAAALQIVVTVAGAGDRRSAAVALRTQGWTAGRVRRWQLAEQLPGLLVVALAAAVILVLTHASRPAMLAAIVALGIALFGTLAAVWWRGRAHARVRVRRSGTGAMSTPVRVGWRQVRAMPLGAVTHVIGAVLLAFAVVGAYLVVVDARHRAGATRLAGSVWSATSGAELGLAGVGVFAAVVLVVLARRISLARRHSEWALLRATGWTRRSIRRLTGVELAAALVPAVVIAVAAAALVTVLAVPAGSAWLAAGMAAAAVIVVTAVAQLATRKPSEAER